MVREFRHMHELGIVPLNSIQRRIGCGNETRFWKDIWCQNFCFAEKFPRLFALELDKECLVADRVRRGAWLWRRGIRGGAEMAQFQEMLDDIATVNLGTERDCWVWSLMGMSEFAVKGVCKYIDDCILESNPRKTIWLACLPRKINICAWRVLGNRLPTRANLDDKGIEVASVLCPMCNDMIESNINVFAKCRTIEKIWDLIERWLEVELPVLRFPRDLMEWIGNSNMNAVKKEVVGVVCFVAWWAIWKLRNDIVFKNDRPKDRSLFDDVVYFSFIWYSSRKNKSSRNWVKWLQNPLLFM